MKLSCELEARICIETADNSRPPFQRSYATIIRQCLHVDSLPYYSCLEFYIFILKEYSLNEYKGAKQLKYKDRSKLHGFSKNKLNTDDAVNLSDIDVWYFLNVTYDINKNCLKQIQMVQFFYENLRSRKRLPENFMNFMVYIIINREALFAE